MKKIINILILTFLTINLCSIPLFSQSVDSSRLFRLITFGQSLKQFSVQKSIGFKIEFNNVDTLDSIADVRINFYFSKKAINAMLKSFIQKDSLKKAIKMKHWKINHENNTTLLFKNVKFLWSDKYECFVSRDTIVLCQVNDIILTRKVKGYLCFYQKFEGLDFNLLIYPEIKNEELFYYFNYKWKLFQAVSSNKEFNEIICDKRPNHRILREKKGLSQYTYTISTDAKRRVFLKRITDDPNFN